MSPCNPSDTSISISPAPPIPIPGFGIPISPVQLPLSGVDLPNVQSLLDLINDITAIIPGGTLNANLSDVTPNNVLSAIMNILSQMAPYLTIYNFFQAAFNMISCILNVICSLTNPFKLFKAIRKLFKTCVPAFLSLFPFMALIVMILSLLLLIIALVEYIITAIEKIIEDLIANLEVLANGLSLQDEDAVTATVRKIAQLLCFIENILAVLVAIGSIISIIEALASLAGQGVCSDDGADGCCSPDVCPPFIKDTADAGITGTLGELIYYRRIDTDVGSIFGSLSPEQISSFNLPALRNESWQFVNQDLQQLFPFSDIITSVDGGDIFFPEGVTYTKNTKPTKVPYTLDLTFKDFNPKVFNPSDSGQPRNFIIRDVIVTEKPYIGVIDFDNHLNKSINDKGTLSLAGGLAYEIQADQSQLPYLINGNQATIESFIHLPNQFGFLPQFDDGYVIGDVDFTLNIHQDVLMGYGLITLGCTTDVSIERFVANAQAQSIGFDPINVKLPNALPNVLGAQQCASASLAKLRQNVSPENVAIFQAEVTACLEQLRSESLSSYCGILKAGVSVYKSTINLNTDIEFITRPIKVAVQLLDPNGTILSKNMPSTCVDGLLVGQVTLGQISDFIYDGYSTFNAEINSKQSGNGQLTVIFDNNTFKKILGVDDINVQSSIVDNIINYQFINTNTIVQAPGSNTYEENTRKDEGDVARDGEA